MEKARRVAGTMLACVVGLSGMAVPAALAAEGSVERGTGPLLRLYWWQAPTIANPHLSAGTKDLSASRLTYEPLASFDREGALVPFLAAEIPSLENGGVAPDGSSVTWTLREDVQWSDGQPFTAADVAFTFAYATHPEVRSTSASAFAGVERVEAVDDHTVRVTFRVPTGAWSTPFTGPQGMIIPQHVFEPLVGPEAAMAPANLMAVGTGPYRIREFVTEDVLIVGGDAVPTTKIVYEVNPFYRDPDRPWFSGVELRGGGGDAEFAAALARDGLTDVAWNVLVGDDVADDLEAGGIARLDLGPSAFVERIMINFTDPHRATAEGERSSLAFPHPFLTDLRVRQAFAHAVDRTAILASYGRTATPTTNLVVSPAAFDSPNTAELYPYDLERAAALLEEAGWADTDGDGVRDKGGLPLRVTFQTSFNPVRQAAQEIVETSFERIGIDVENKQVDSSAFLGPVEGTTDTRRQFYADLEEFAFSNKAPDPEAYLAAWTCDEAAQMANAWSGANWARYCDAEYDALHAQLVGTTDPGERRDLIIALNDHLIGDVALIPLVAYIEPTGVRTDLAGLSVTAWDVPTWNVADWRLSE